MSQSSDVSGWIVATASALVLLALVFLACCTCFAQEYPIVTPFPLPKQMTSVGGGITLAELNAVHAALNADSELRQPEAPVYTPAQFADTTVTPVDLGPLGRAMIVSFDGSESCGATGNCPMALYLPAKTGYRPALHFGGWGFWIVPSPGTVPDVVSAWNMSCCDEIYTRYRYGNGGYAEDACAEGLTDPDSADPEKFTWKACKPGTPTFTPRQAMPTAGTGSTYETLQQLQKVAEPDVRGISSIPFSRMPVITLRHWAVVAVPGSSTARLFVYPRTSTGIAKAVLRNVPGDSVAETEIQQRDDRFNPAPMVPAPALVIARRNGAGTELALYHEPGSDPHGLPSEGRMLRDACEQAMPKSGAWPAAWDAGAFRIRAVVCNAPNAAAATIDGTAIGRAEQDSSGTVWGITAGFNSVLVRWDGQWQPALGPVPNSMATLGPGPEGGVVVGWGSGSGRGPDWLEGSTIRPFPSDNNFIANTLRLAGGGALLTTAPEITRPIGDTHWWVSRWPSLSILGADGKELATYVAEAGQFDSLPSDSNAPMCLAPFASLAVNKTTTWIWTPPKNGCLGLRGFLTTDGHTFDYLPRINGAPVAPYSALSVWPGDRVAAAVRGDGIYLIDPVTRTAQRLDPPAPEAFQRIAAVFRAGTDGYVLVEGHCNGVGSRHQCDPLWRWREGRWQLVIAALDLTPRVPCWVETPQYCSRNLAWAEDKNGVWVAGVGSGVWRIPPSGEAEQFTPQNGFPLSSPTQLFALGDGSILAINNEFSRSFAFSPPARGRR